MKHFNVTFKPDDRQISIHKGATLIEAAGQAGIILNTVCGGRGICKRCAVNIEPAGQEVLACQYHIQQDITVTIPDNSRFFEQKILAHGIETETDFEPDVYRKYPKTAEKILGLAVDIGTTTVVAKLIDMRDGQCLATKSDFNPQARYGDDVISRIGYAKSETGLAKLHRMIIDCINRLIVQLCKEAAVEAKDIYEACMVGNTTMNHIFLKLPVAGLGRAPFRAFSLEAKDLPAEQLSLQINPAGNIHTAANIAAFVGSDAVAAGLAVGIDSAKETTLIVDIGTNGELVLGSSERLYGASCAAGPALEGAGISCGGRAADGAIEAVIVNEWDIDFDVIGPGPAHCICGSGLIDAVAVMLDLGIVDATGRFVERQRLREQLVPAILSRVIEKDGQMGFALADEVIITQKDVRQVQLAKAAIRAGVKLLQKKIGLQDGDIKQILLAGAFGNFIRAESAVRIGLLPDVPLECVRFVGNAAVSGAQMILLSTRVRKEAEQLAGKIEYVEIANERDFVDVYTDCMAF